MMESKGDLPVHEFREIYQVITYGSIMVGKDAIVHKFPTKRVWNDDDDAFGCFPIFRLGDISVSTMDFSDFT